MVVKNYNYNLQYRLVIYKHSQSWSRKCFSKVRAGAGAGARLIVTALSVWVRELLSKPSIFISKMSTQITPLKTKSALFFYVDEINNDA
jgi:hypothetical protein